MTSDKIRAVALKHFTKNGFEGASLADIAADVGIKKQSIYAHYKGKDELFLTVFEDVVTREMLFMEDYLNFKKTQPLENLLYKFLYEYRKRYEQEDDTKLYLRTAFFPPAHLDQRIIEYYNEHSDRIITLFEATFAAKIGEVHPDVSHHQASSAFLAILDGMFVEMLYGNLERSQLVLEASWHIYWRGIRNI